MSYQQADLKVGYFVHLKARPNEGIKSEYGEIVMVDETTFIVKVETNNVNDDGLRETSVDDIERLVTPDNERYFVRESAQYIGWVIKDSLNGYTIVPGSLKETKALADTACYRMNKQWQQSLQFKQTQMKSELK